MPWFRLAFRPDGAADLASGDRMTAQRLFDMT